MTYLKILFFITVITRVIYLYAQPDFCTDHVTQMAVADNIVNGHGPTLAFANLDNHDLTDYRVNILWPPLYSYLLSGLYFITGNHLLSSFILKILILLSVLLLIAMIVKLIVPNQKEAYPLIILSLLTITTSIINNLNTILYLPMLFFSISLYFLMKHFIQNGGRRYLFLNISSFFSGLMAWSHYGSVLPAFYVPLTIAVLYIIRPKTRLLFQSFISGFIVLIVVSGVFAYNYFVSGSFSYMTDGMTRERGFFIEHIFKIMPLIPASLFKIDYISLIGLNSYLNSIIIVLLHIISFSAFMFFISLLYKKIKTGDLEKYSINLYIIIALTNFICLTIIFLSYFSLTYKELLMPEWTYLGEGRYYGNVFLSLLLVIYFFTLMMNNIQKKIVFTLLTGFVILNLFFNVLIIKKEWSYSGFSVEKILLNEEETYLSKDIYNNIKELKKDSLNVIFADTRITVRSWRMAALAGASILNPENLIINNLNSSILLFPLYKESGVFPLENNLRLNFRYLKCESIGTEDVNVSLFKAKK